MHAIRRLLTISALTIVLGAIGLVANLLLNRLIVVPGMTGLLDVTLPSSGRAYGTTLKANIREPLE